MGFTDDLTRERALRLYFKGFTSKEVADMVGVNRHSVRRWASEAGGRRRHTYVIEEQHEAASPVGCDGPAGEGEAGKLASSRETSPAVLFTRPKREPITHYVIPDTQCKPGVPLDHLYWAGRYAAEQGYTRIIHLGDHWDMPSLSSYESKGSKYFEGKRYKNDIAAGNSGLYRFVEGLTSNGRTLLQYDLDFLMGNHEDRITRAINSDPKLEGLIGFEDLELGNYGWRIYDYLTPAQMNKIWYAHYFYNPMSGRSYSGAIETMLRNIGHSFTMGHQQGYRIGRRELAGGQVQMGLVAGSFYQHEEDYKGPQGNKHWRGVVVKHEVKNGGYDPMFVSLEYLKKRFKEG